MSPPVYPVIPVLRIWARSAYQAFDHELRLRTTHRKTFTIFGLFQVSYSHSMLRRKCFGSDQVRKRGLIIKIS